MNMVKTWSEMTEAEKDDLMWRTFFPGEIPTHPGFMHSRDKCAEAEEAFCRAPHLRRRYARELLAMIDPEWSIFDTALEINSPRATTGSALVVAIATAPPDVRCRAMLRAMGVDV